MAARRLIAILLVLLFLSSLAAALAPVQEGMNTDSSSSSTTTSTDAPALSAEGAAGESRLITQTIDASGLRPAVIRARPGDRLELKVTSSRPGTIELVGIGPAEDVGEGQPAFFDVLIRAEGSYPVRFLDTGNEIARIEVSPPRLEPAVR